MQACGGGDGDGEDEPPPAPTTSVSLSRSSITVSATPGELMPVEEVTLTVSNPPDEGLYLEGEYSAGGIETVGFLGTSASQGTLQISFRSPGSLLNDTYADTITLRICTDAACATQIKGSPATISTAYVVTGTGTSTGTLDRARIEIISDSRDDTYRYEHARVTLDVAPPSGIHIQTSKTSNGVQWVGAGHPSALTVDVEMSFIPATQLGAGTFADAVSVELCYDASCVRQVGGSPFVIETEYTVIPGHEAGFTPLAVASRIALAHDVIDAEISKPLNQIVMVGSYPVNALYVYDIATGIETQALLSRVPTSVSIAPDGLSAAVGHDSLVSVVDLTTVGQAGAPAPETVSVGAIAYDVVLDGAGYVHVLPTTPPNYWSSPVRSVHIATNTEIIGPQHISSDIRGRLHPSGNFIYTANGAASSPSDIEKWDITSGVMSYLYDSRYHGEYSACRDLWLDDSGSRIYSACGHAFSTSTIQDQDIIYAGALELSDDWTDVEIRSFSLSAAANEIALIDHDPASCGYAPWDGICYTHFALYEADFLNRKAIYSIGPVTADGTPFAQWGMFIFHDAAGTGSKYMISRLEDAPDRNNEFFLSVIP